MLEWTWRDRLTWKYSEYSFHVQRIQFVSVLQYCTHVFDLYMVNSCRRSTCLVHYKFIERINFWNFIISFTWITCLCCAYRKRTQQQQQRKTALILRPMIELCSRYSARETNLFARIMVTGRHELQIHINWWRWSNRSETLMKRISWRLHTFRWEKSQSDSILNILHPVFIIKSEIRTETMCHLRQRNITDGLLHRDSLQSSDKIVLHVACLIFITKMLSHTHKVAAPLMPNIWSRLT